MAGTLYIVHLFKTYQSRLLPKVVKVTEPICVDIFHYYVFDAKDTRIF